MEYDNNNRGATFPPRGKQKFILQGNGEIDHKPIKVVMVSDESKEGRKYIEIYEKIGVIFDNKYKEPNDKKPHYTGPLEKYNKRMACWKAKKDSMEYMSFKISEPEERLDNKELDDEIPFGKELDEMAKDLAKKEGRDGGW
tara:strand:- start:1483 stop:1905 length:423 start_codon:yes stop_codon:yes gene_type:complete